MKCYLYILHFSIVLLCLVLATHIKAPQMLPTRAYEVLVLLFFLTLWLCLLGIIGYKMTITTTQYAVLTATDEDTNVVFTRPHFH